MKRGEIWWVKLDQPVGRRPVLLLSRDEAYTVRSLVIVSPITARVRRTPTEVVLGSKEGMPQDCVVNLDTIITIPRDSLESHLTTLSSRKLKEVEAALRFSLGFGQ